MYNSEKNVWCEKDDENLVLDLNEIISTMAMIKSEVDDEEEVLAFE